MMRSFRSLGKPALSLFCVLVYDQSFWSREGSELKELPAPARRFFFLRQGDRYDMKARAVR